MSIQNKHTLKSIRKNSNNGAIAYSDDYYNEIEGSRRDDILIGTQWHDKIEGEEGNDQLFGLAGNDKLEGEEGNDLLVGGTGNDYLEGNEGSDTYRFSVGDGNDVVYDKDKKFWSSSSSTDVIEFTDVSSQDVSYQVAGPNLIIRYGNNDSIVVRNFQTSDGKIEQFKFTDRTLSYNDLLGVINGQGGQGGGGTQLPPIIDPPIQPENPNGVLPGNPGNRNQIIGTSRNDKLKGTYLDDYIYGGAGNDKIDGKDGNDLIYGGAGHDDIEGGRGDDIIYGGTGNDKIEGDEGNDQLFGEAGNDKLEGEEGNDLLVGGTGNDYLEGNEGSDTYRFSVGDGNDVVYDKDKKFWSSSSSTDVIEFTDVSSQDVSYQVAGPNLIIRYGNNDSIVVRNFQTSDGKIEQFKFTDRTLSYNDLLGVINEQGGQGGGGTQLPPIIDPPIQPENPNGVLPGNPGNRNQIIGTSRNDKLKGTYLDDYIYGGAGNDKIDGKDGNDLIYGGAGHDDIEGGRGDDIIYGGTGNDKIEGDEGNDQLFGEAGNDKLEGEEGNDLLVGGTGNDYLEGNEGSDTYRFSVGDGNDVVYDKDKKFWSSSSSTDVIEFTDVSSQDVSYQVAGPNLIIRYGNNDSIVVRNFQTSDGKIEQFKFTDRTLSYNDLLGVINGQGGQGGGGTQLPPIIDPPIQPENPNGVLPGNPGNRNQIIGTSRNDKLKGTYLDDYIYGGAGNDKIDGKDGNDLIYGGAGHDDIEGGRGDDIIYGGTGNDKIEGDEGNDQLFGEAGNDKLEGEEGNDLLVGGTGNDYLEGNEGSDTYRFSVGDGHDIVYDKDKKIWSSSTSTDVIEFTDVSSQDVSYYVSGPNLIIRYGNNDSIVVRNFQTSDGKIEQFKFTDRVMTYDDVIGTIQQQNRPFVLNSNPVLAEGNGTQELHSLLSAMSAFGVKTDSSVSVENTDTTSILTSGNYMLTSSSR